VGVLESMFETSKSIVMFGRHVTEGTSGSREMRRGRQVDVSSRGREAVPRVREVVPRVRGIIPRVREIVPSVRFLPRAGTLRVFRDFGVLKVDVALRLVKDECVRDRV